MSKFVEVIKDVLPFIGTALGGPLGTGVASFVASKLGVSPTDVSSTLASMLGNPEELAKLKAIEADYQTHCLALGYASVKDLETINASVVVEVNKTMQAEAASEHWPSYSWRPFIGFSFGLYINSMWLLPLFKVQPVILSPDTVLAIGGILGVASWFRGKMQADPTIPTINRG
jgi:hypothetical protein